MRRHRRRDLDAGDGGTTGTGATTGTGGTAGSGGGRGAPIPIDPMASAYAISAAPGICGDDALIAYGRDTTDGIVRVARVRGGAVEASTVGGFPDNAVMHVSITTRPASVK